MSTETKKHNAGAFVLAGISFIPMIGVIPGIICVINALIRRVSNSKLLGILGFSGIMVSVILYGVILPQLMKSDIFSKGFEPHARSAMTSLVRNIEYYKLQNGSYPESMQALRESLKDGEMVFSIDPTGSMKQGHKPRDFYYEIINEGENYLLFSVGADNKPFTEDDLYPIIDISKDKNIGWLQNK